MLALEASTTEPTFDIFADAPEKDPVWVEAVQELPSARERMEQIAQKTPGQYFVFFTGSHSILARTETFKKPQLSKAKTV